MSGEVERVGRGQGAYAVRRAHLSSRARQRLQQSVPAETLRAYRREWPKFLAWCADRGWLPLPASSDAVTNWVSERCDAGHSESIIKQGIAAVMFFHDQANVPEAQRPDTSDAWRVVRGYRRERVESGWWPEEAATFTIEELRLMCATLPEGKLSTVRDRAILTAGTSIFARRSMLIDLDLKDVQVVGPGELVLRVTRGKEDQWAQGRGVEVTAGSHPMSDPVGALAQWMDVLHGQGIVDGPLFRRLVWAKRGHRVLDHRLNASWVNKLVKQTAEDAGLKAPSGRKYRAHSLRAAGATISLRAGKPPVVVARRGGWSPKGNQVHTYNRPEENNNAMEGLM